MGVLEQILEQLKIMAANGGGGYIASAAAEPEEDAPRTTKKPPAKTAKGPSLEDVQDLIRELVGADADNKPKIKAAIKKIDKAAERAGDFEDDAAKLGKLHDALTALKGDDSEGEAEEDDML